MKGAARGAASATRRIGADGRERAFFGGCSYLGLAHEARVLDAARDAAERFGVGAGAARGTTGTCVLHEALEAELAAFAGAEDAALFSDAALADLAVGLAFVREGERVVCDLDAHPCVTDAVRAGGGRVVHGDDDALAAARAEGCAFAFTDGTFPSAARTAPIDALVAAGFERIAIDDAHGFGLLGARGAGAAEALDLTGDRDLLVVALSKCLGAAGGAVLGSRRTVDAVRATSAFACTTAPPPPIVAAALAALRIARDDDARRARALSNARALHALVDAIDPAPTRRAVLFPVRALALDSVAATTALHAHLVDAGIDAPLIRYPGGPAGDHLRFAITSEHTDADLGRLEEALRTAPVA